MKTLRNALAVLTLCFISSISFSQEDSLAVFKEYPTIPAFKLMQVDSTIVNIKDLVDKKKETVIIIFSPTCSHCQHQAEEITSHINDLKDVNFIFSTVYSINEMKAFIGEFALDRFPNIHVVHDSNNLTGTFYNIKGLPGIFVYNKKGKLVADFKTNVKIDALLAALKK